MDYIKVDAHFKTLNILNVSFELYFVFIMSDFDPSFLLLSLRKKMQDYCELRWATETCSQVDQ